MRMQVSLQPLNTLQAVVILQLMLMMCLMFAVAIKNVCRNVELKAFQAGVDAGASALMTAHTIFPAYDEEYPATLSKKDPY
jgi:hypothetical protein